MTFLLQGSRKRALGSLYSDGDVSIPDFEHGETKPITVGLIENIPQPLDSRIFEPQDITGWTFRAALGKGFLPPVAGQFTITYGANTSAALGPTPSVAEVSTAVNALASVIAAGGITVSGGSGFFYFTFVVAGSRTALSGDATNLAPLSILDFGTLIEGTVSVKEVQILRILQNPGGFCSLTLASTPSGAGVSLVQVGGSGLNAKYRLSFAMRTSGLLVTGGTYKITKFETGDVFTNVGAASNATGVIFIATGTTPTTWSNGSAISRIPNEATLPYDGSFSILVRGVESALLDFDATEAEVVAALEGITLTSGTVVTGAKYKIVTFATGDVFTNIGAGSNATGVVFTASGTTPTTWTNGSVLSPVAAGNVSVSRESEGQYLIAFQGDMANTAMGTISADGSALKVVQTLSGVLDLRTAAIDILLAGEDSISAVFEIEGTPPGGTVQKLFRQDVTLLDSIIDPSSTSPPIEGAFGVIAYEDEHTLELSDANKWIQNDTVDPLLIHIPDEADVAFPITTTIFAFNTQDGGIQFDCPGSATVIALDGFTTNLAPNNHSSGTLRKIGSDLWLLTGDLDPV